MEADRRYAAQDHPRVLRRANGNRVGRCSERCAPAAGTTWRDLERPSERRILMHGHQSDQRTGRDGGFRQAADGDGGVLEDRRREVLEELGGVSCHFELFEG